MDHEAMQKLLKKIPTMKSKPISHDKKDQLILIDIGCECYLTHLTAWDYFLLNRKHKYFLPVRGNLVAVCNLTNVLCSIAFNDVKWVVAYVAWTL